MGKLKTTFEKHMGSTSKSFNDPLPFACAGPESLSCYTCNFTVFKVIGTMENISKCLKANCSSSAQFILL